jgi:hypothetical protein
VLTPLSFAHIPPPLPRSSRKMLFTLSSLPDFGLRRAPTISTGTLGFSRLARRSIFIVVCTLAGSLNEPFASRASTGRSLVRIASTASGWNVSCRVGYLPPTGSRCPFHGTPKLRLSQVCPRCPAGKSPSFLLLLTVGRDQPHDRATEIVASHPAFFSFKTDPLSDSDDQSNQRPITRRRPIEDRSIRHSRDTGSEGSH